MTLSNETKGRIFSEYISFRNNLYAGKSLEERQELDQFFTPPEITIKMIEKFNVDSLSGLTILDPTSGSGNLLVACLIAGADPDKLFGNEYDLAMVKLCRERIKKVCKQYNLEGFKDYQIHRGNALQKRCLTQFDEEYIQNYNPQYIDDINYAQDDAEEIDQGLWESEKGYWDKEEEKAKARSKPKKTKQELEAEKAAKEQRKAKRKAEAEAKAAKAQSSYAFWAQE